MDEGAEGKGGGARLTRMLMRGTIEEALEEEKEAGVVEAEERVAQSEQRPTESGRWN